jgi:hypothetical protein
MSRLRAIHLFCVALGLLALGCGRQAEPTNTTQARTTGMEEPLTAEQGPAQPGSTGMAQGSATSPGATGSTTQPGSTTSPMQPGMEPSISVSDAEIASFADVIVRLAELEHEASARVESGQPPEQVTAELQPRVDRVFDGTMLTADRFKEIADQAEQDPALRQRIEARLQERAQSPA